MRKIFMLVLLTVASTTAQVRTLKFKFESDRSKEKNIMEDLERFKKSETIFAMPEYYSLEAYKSILDEVWDLTPYKLIYEKDLNVEHYQVGKGIVKLLSRGSAKRKIGEDLPSSSTYLAYLQFQVIDEVKVKRKNTTYNFSLLGLIYFTPGTSAIKDMYFEEKKRIVRNADLVNYKYVYLKNFIKQVNDNLKEGKIIDFTDDYFFPELSNLKSEVLYIDVDIFKGRALNSDIDMEGYLTTKLENYTLNYEIISYDDLEKKMNENSDKDFYYLMVNQINSYKMISVVNGKTGKIIYQDVTNMSYELKDTDFKKLEEAINEAE